MLNPSHPGKRLMPQHDCQGFLKIIMIGEIQGNGWFERQKTCSSTQNRQAGHYTKHEGTQHSCLILFRTADYVPLKPDRHGTGQKILIGPIKNIEHQALFVFIFIATNWSGLLRIMCKRWSIVDQRISYKIQQTQEAIKDATSETETVLRVLTAVMLVVLCSGLLTVLNCCWGWRLHGQRE